MKNFEGLFEYIKKNGIQSKNYFKDLCKQFGLSYTLFGQVYSNKSILIEDDLEEARKIVNYIISLFPKDVYQKIVNSKYNSFDYLIRCISFGVNESGPFCDICDDGPIDIKMLDKKYLNYSNWKDKSKDEIIQLLKENRWFLICSKCNRNSEVRKIISIKTELNNLNKYGVKNVSELQEVKQKISQYKQEYKYEEQQKREKTCLERYGVKNVMFNQDVKLKHKEIVTSLDYRNKVSTIQRQLYRESKKVFTEEMIKKFVKCTRESNMKKGYSNFIKNVKENNLATNVTLEDWKNNGGYGGTYIVKCLECGNEFQLCPVNNPIKCLNCNNNFRSTYEDEIYDFIKSINEEIKIERNVRNLLDDNNLEIDIYLPEYKLGIEFNGSYWHSSVFKYPKYHQDKVLKAKQNGIRLIHIFEHEYIKNKEKILGLLMSLVNKSQNKVYGRQCNVKEINVEQYRDFLNMYHMQGYQHSNIMLGLYYNKELISVLGLGKPRFNKNYQYELIRYCVNYDYYVVGGFDKLIKYFIDNYQPESIISYVDLKYFDGSNYDNSKFFEFKEVTNPSYVYVSTKTFDVIKRLDAQKHKLPEILEKFNPKLSEYDNMILNGYYRIYDCGNLVYTYK
jgi:hypothetical protein